MKKILFILVLTFTAFSCKSDKKDIQTKTVEQKKEIDEQIAKNPFFTVKLTAKVEKDDNFRLLYTEDLAEPFNGKKAIFKEVEGSSNFQTIEFILKNPDIYPAKLRMHLGYNKDQKKVTVQSVEILHNNAQFKIPDSLMNKYFYPNKYIEYNKATGEAIFIEENGNHVPFFVSREPLHDILNNEF